MQTETYKGRKIKVRVGRKHEWGTMHAWINGEKHYTVEKFDEDKALAEIRRAIDHIDEKPVDGDRWGAYLYAPGTYRLCDEGIHPVALDGECQHVTCVRRRAAA